MEADLVFCVSVSVRLLSTSPFVPSLKPLCGGPCNRVPRGVGTTKAFPVVGSIAGGPAPGSTLALAPVPGPLLPPRPDPPAGCH